MKLVFGNIKMNMLNQDVTNYLDGIENDSNAIYIPPFIYLKDFINKGLSVGAQDVSFKEIGAMTGDISASQLKSIGVTYAIVSHSERRANYQDDKFSNQKIKRCLENGIIPILCIGELLEEKEKGITKEVLTSEIDEAFLDINPDELKDVIIAYEPVWAISTYEGILPNREIIDDIALFIKNYLKDKYNLSLRLLYGGSVNEVSCDEFNNCKFIDGYLVGGCSLKKDKFKELIEKCK